MHKPSENASIMAPLIAPRVYRVVESLYAEMNDHVPSWGDMTEAGREHYTNLVAYIIDHPQAKAMHVAIEADHPTEWETIPAREAAIYHVMVASVPALWVAELTREDETEARENAVVENATETEIDALAENHADEIAEGDDAHD